MTEQAVDAAKTKKAKKAFPSPWLVAHVQYVEALKRKSANQTALLALYKKTDRTAVENKALLALESAEKAMERAEKAAQAAKNLTVDAEKKAAAEARKARNHKLIKLGVLFEMLGLDSRSEAELIGMLIEAKSDNSRVQKWQALGKEFLEKQSVKSRQRRLIETRKNRLWGAFLLLIVMV